LEGALQFAFMIGVKPYLVPPEVLNPYRADGIN